MESAISRLAPPKAPREFGFHLDGGSAPTERRNLFERRSPGQGTSNLKKLGRGRYIAPTVFSGVASDMSIACEAGVNGVDEYTQVKSVPIEIGKRDHWIK